VFRRSSKTETTTTVAPDKGPGAKGRPTPTRKEAEAAARERAKAGMVEFLLPILIVVMGMQYSKIPGLVTYGAVLMQTVLLVVVLDTVWLVIRTKRALRKEFPGDPLKGVTSYTIMRVVQMRPLRQPKPQVRIGGKPK
jgi:hypothetical protein